MSDTDYFAFTRDSDDGKALLVWRDALSARKGERAELRRCRSTADILLSQAYYTALRETKARGRVDTTRFARVVGLLAHIEKDSYKDSDKRVFAAQMATGKEGGPARVSGLRFRRLLTLGDDDMFYQSILRTIRLLDRNVDILSVAEGVYWWNDRTRRAWANAYYTTSQEQV
jgi:CRISPR system Cascade subunit CasB